MEAKEILKLGTFVRNLILSNRDFQNISRDLGIDRSTEPGFVLKLITQELPPKDLTTLLQKTRNSPVHEFAEKFLKILNYGNPDHLVS